jgi:chemotaxis protein MotB
MARKRNKKGPEGAPLWVVSYGDMMSLLLTFFVLLASLANFDDVHDRFMTAIQSIREALGMRGQVGREIDDQVDFHSLIQRLESLVKPDMPKNRGNTVDKGLHGKEFRLRRIRDGMEITIGGPVLFDPFSSELNDRGKQAIMAIGDELKGHRNKIEIRGHAADDNPPPDWTLEDTMKLSHDRALVVMEELILRGVDPRTIRLMSCGATEPVAQSVYDPNKRAMNRRVEIIVRESQVIDYLGQAPVDMPPATQPE